MSWCKIIKKINIRVNNFIIIIKKKNSHVQLVLVNLKDNAQAVIIATHIYQIILVYIQINVIPVVLVFSISLIKKYY